MSQNQSMLRRTRMTNVDAAWLHMEEPNNLMMITAVIMFESAVDWQALRQVIRDRLLAVYPRFLMRPQVPTSLFGATYWDPDPAFDLETHVTEVQMPAPGTQTELQNMVSDLMSTQLDWSKPLWHFHFVDGYGGDGSAVLVRLHHAIADGIALARLLISLTDTENLTAVKEVGLGVKKQAGQRALSTGRGNNWLGRLGTGLRLAAKTAPAFGKLTLSLPDSKTVFRGSLVTAKRAAWSTPLSLADVKRIGRATNSTVNDILIAAFASALRRYLIVRDSLVNTIRVAVPVNLRPLEGPIELGNKFGLVFLTLPVGVASADERLASLKAEMNQIKRSPEALVAFGLLGVMGAMPPPLERLVMRLFGAKISGVLTNVPGPREPIYLAGSRVSDLMVWVPQSGGVGLGLSILSYNGRVLIGVATDSSLVPDPETIISAFEDEFTTMLAAY